MSDVFWDTVYCASNFVDQLVSCFFSQNYFTRLSWQRVTTEAGAVSQQEHKPSVITENKRTVHVERWTPITTDRSCALSGWRLLTVVMFGQDSGWHGNAAGNNAVTEPHSICHISQPPASIWCPARVRGGYGLRRWSHQRSYSTSSPVSTEMGDRSRYPILMFNQPLRPTYYRPQLCEMGNE